MPVLRASWWILAIAAVALTLWIGSSPIGDVSMSCGKIGELKLSGVPQNAQCSDSIWQVLGVRPMAFLGLSMTIPLVVAALAMRMWASWLAVVALLTVSIGGLVNWATYWGILLAAFPLAGIAFLLALVQLARRGSA